MKKMLTDALDELFVKQGLPLADSLEVLSRGKNGKLAKVACFLLEALREGNEFSDALRECPYAVFDSVYVSFVMISERSGNLIQTISFLKRRYERMYQNRQKVLEASMYPLFIISLGFSAGIFLLRYSGTALDFNLILSFMMLFFIAFLFFLIVWKFIEDDRFTDVLFAIDFLVKNGASVSSAVGFAVNVAGANSKMGQKLLDAKVKLEYGLSLSAAFELSGRAADVLYYAEKGGTDSNVFGKLAAWQEEKYKQRRKICLSLIEPVFIGITGAFLLILVVHIFMPFMTDMSWL